jgi:hypothetical protein
VRVAPLAYLMDVCWKEVANREVRNGVEEEE